MDAESPRPVDDPRVYLAAERTYLAWVRTSLGLMGFGFIVARFGHVLQALETRSEAVRALPFAPLLGGAMVMFGAGVCLVAAMRHRIYVRALRAGVGNPPIAVRADLIVAMVLSAASLAMALLILTT